MSFRYVEFGEVVELHQQLLDLFGGLPGFRGQEGAGLVESALNRPLAKAHYEGAGLIAQAAALLFGLAKNHGFLDGNKRIAVAVADAFLQFNGFEIVCSNDELYDFVAGCSDSGWTEVAVERFLEARVHPLSKQGI